MPRTVLDPSCVKESTVSDDGGASVRRARVVGVVPCFNRAEDLDRLLSDVRELRLECCEAKGERSQGFECESPASRGRRTTVSLSLVIVDNASELPITAERETVRACQESMPIEILNLDRNVGGSGGFNAGIRAALEILEREEKKRTAFESQSENAGGQQSGTGAFARATSFIWLVDSDARLTATTLMELVQAMLRRDDAAAVGSAIADPVTKRVFEVGGRVDRRNGRFKPVLRGVAGAPWDVEADYAAACSVLVRVEAIVRTGLMPDVFLNSDDVDWFLRMRRATGQRILASSRSVVYHPRFSRYALAARYYVARNALNPLRTLGLGRGVLARRALHEVVRAMGCDVSLRSDLSKLHLRGLRDSANGLRTGPAGADRIRFERFVPLEQLARHLLEESALTTGRAHEYVKPRAIAAHDTVLRELPASDLETLSDQIRAIALSSARWSTPLDITQGNESRIGEVVRMIGRACGIGRPHIAIVGAKPRLGSIFAGRWIVQIAPGAVAGERAGFVVLDGGAGQRVKALARAGASALKGMVLSTRLALSGEEGVSVEQVGALGASAEGGFDVPRRLTLSIVVLSYNRREKLCATLARLCEAREIEGAEIVVVDNGSTDGSVEAARGACPRARVIALDTNVGVAALNTGVEAACGDAVLVLDDDAWPDEGVLMAALTLLSRRADLDGVALHPHHPAMGRSEWPFAMSAGEKPEKTQDRWPVMGCGNLVRRRAWLRVGGYEPEYFLYRNDVDLALKLLAQNGEQKAGCEAGDACGESTSARRGVHFNPTWIVWHDSPAAAAKSARWHWLATRNWVWTARRHGRGASGLVALALGVVWAHKLAGFSGLKQWQTLRGTCAGVMSTPPPLPQGVRADGRHFTRLLRLHLSRVFGRT